MTKNLSKPIPLPDTGNADELFDIAYDIFKIDLNCKANRPKLFNKFIYIDANKTFDGQKIDGFWHVASIGADDSKYDMYPCYNDAVYSKCKYLCNVDHPDNFLNSSNSIPCLYRCNKVKWIKEIIEIANKNKEHKNLRIWKKRTKKGEKRLFIRYINDDIDYVIIFKITYKNNDIYFYRLITAYPVVLKSYKRRFDKEYQAYISKN